MKKLLLALLAAGTVSAANAQEPNSILLYGNVGFNSQSISNTTGSTINWNATPGIGYQFNKNWTVGLTLSWMQNANKNDSGTSTTVNTYSAGVFVRYSEYIADSKTFFFFGQVEGTYQGHYTTMADQPAFDKYHGFQFNLFPALGINVGHYWALNFSVGGLSYTTEKASGSDNSLNTFNFTLGQQYNFGVSKNFGMHHMHGHHEPGDDMRHMDTSDDSNDSSSSDDNGGRHHRHRHHGDNDNKDKNNDE